MIPDRVSGVAIGLNHRCAADSQASREVSKYSQSKALEAAYIQGMRQYLFVSLDHMLALERSFRPLPQALSLTPWTCARVILESCAKSIWLLDLDITAKDRITRSMNYMLIDQLELLKYIRSSRSDQSGQLEATEVAKRRAESRITELREQAQELDITEKMNKSHKFIGFGPGMPSTLDLVRLSLGRDMVSKYRLFSAAMHGSGWATLTVGARIDRSLHGPKAVPQLSPVHAMLLVILSVQSFSVAACHHFKLYGGIRWPNSILEHGYDQAYTAHG